MKTSLLRTSLSATGRKLVLILVLLAGAGLLLAACGPTLLLGNPAMLLHEPPAAPGGLRVSTADGLPLASNSWTNQRHLQLGATLGGPVRAAVLRPEVEFLPADIPFIGVPNVVGGPNATSVAIPEVASGQQYHWQVRAHEVGGRAGPWTRFDGTIGFVDAPPPAPSIAPLPRDGNVSQKQLTVEWTADGGPAGIAGFAYTVDRSATGEPPTQANTNASSVAITLPEDGDWFFHLRTLDGAGNWSSTATLPIHLDSVPLTLSSVTYRTAGFNPGYATLPISFRLNKPATVTLAILPPDSEDALRTYDLGPQQDVVKVEWDGKDEAGSAVPSGRYRFRITAADQVGNQTEAVYDKVLVTRKRIEVSLGRESLTAFDGDQVVFYTLITSGGPELPTPQGTFQILAKYSPFTFHSPWPKGSPFWYPDSPTSYAMLFDDGGYFIHDAPWRGWFGPGSNARIGTPGGDNTGTHGCINVPYGVQSRLFFWADVGTPVIVSW